MHIRKLITIFIISISSVLYAQQLKELCVSCFLNQTISPLLIYSPAAFLFHEPLDILGYQKREEFERRIVFLKDNNDHKFVLKCYSDTQKEEAVCEYLGAFIGTSVHVPVNKVKIIVGGSVMQEIDNGTQLATLHTFVPGKELCKWYETPANDIILKGGLISERHLKCLALSNDLCDILVLDIFLNNKDRHHENCFFDEVTNRYYAIDMGDIFLAVRKLDNSGCDMINDLYHIVLRMVAQEKIVACDTYQFLNTLDAQNISIDQKKALKRVLYTMENLMILYPAEVILNMWLSIAQEIGYDYGEYKKTYLKLLLDQNMYWVHKVVEKIKDLV